MRRKDQPARESGHDDKHASERDSILAGQRTRNQDQAPEPPATDGPVVVIGGPTGTGKTAAAVHLAARFNGEIVNADSRYLYRGFDVGTAKPTSAERGGIPHHLIDILDPTEPMSLATFQDLAFATINDILRRGRLPLLVGGTPLYVNSVVEGWQIPRVPPNPAFRRELDAEAARDGIEPLARRLASVDPITAERSGSNLRRIIRGLEVWEATGTPLSRLEGKGPPPYRALEIGLTMPRDALHARVDARVDSLVERGLIDEVRGLLAAGVPPNAPAMSSIGYRQLLPYLDGEATLDEAIERIKIATHRYIRHQETWLRKNRRLVAVDVTRTGWLEHIGEMVEARSRKDFLAPGSKDSH